MLRNVSGVSRAVRKRSEAGFVVIIVLHKLNHRPFGESQRWLSTTCRSLQGKLVRLLMRFSETSSLSDSIEPQSYSLMANPFHSIRGSPDP